MYLGKAALLLQEAKSWNKDCMGLAWTVYGQPDAPNSGGQDDGVRRCLPDRLASRQQWQGRARNSVAVLADGVGYISGHALPRGMVTLGGFDAFLGRVSALVRTLPAKGRTSSS